MKGLQELTNALSNGTMPDPIRPTLPQDWHLQPPPKTQIGIFPGMGNKNTRGISQFMNYKPICKILESTTTLQT